MAFLKIHCGNCGKSWEVYQRDMKKEQSRQCPHCMSEIDSQTWSTQIIPSLCMVSDANRELIKNHLGYQETLFKVDVIEK